MAGLILLADFQSIGEVFGFDTVFLKALSRIEVGVLEAPLCVYVPGALAVRYGHGL